MGISIKGGSTVPKRKNLNPDKWQKTSLVSEHLGVRPAFLTRLVRNGYLKKGKHYINLSDVSGGMRPNYRWNIKELENYLSK